MSFSSFTDDDLLQDSQYSDPDSVNYKFREAVRSDICFTVEGPLFWSNCDELSSTELQQVYLCKHKKLDSAELSVKLQVFFEKWKDMNEFKTILVKILACRVEISLWSTLFG